MPDTVVQLKGNRNLASASKNKSTFNEEYFEVIAFQCAILPKMFFSVGFSGGNLALMKACFIMAYWFKEFQNLKDANCKLLFELCMSLTSSMTIFEGENT